MASKFKVTKPLLKKISTWACNGLDKKDIAHLLGYSPNHFYQMMLDNDEMTAAYNVGKSDMKSLLQNRVMNLALKSKSDLVSLQSSSYLLNRHCPVESDSVNEIEVVVSDAEIIKEITDELQS